MRLFAGVDLGSTSTKAVIVDEAQTIRGSHIASSGNNYKKTGEIVLKEALGESKSNLDDLTSIISTGYGRFVFGLTSKARSEITCCARGAHYLHSNTRTVIDVGGQDSKAIKIDGSGKVLQFSLNDKCAAGTGRFLERIAASLELSLEKMAELSVQSDVSLPISSQCTVFAETEVISKISNGSPIDHIIKGLHTALASRIFSLAVGLDVESDIFICGGGAKNRALVKELEGCFGNVLVPRSIDPRLVPAIGAALIACQAEANSNR